MGAFHDGHLDLMRLARPECDTLVVSLFVNPTQFGPGEDFSRYPRDEERDLALAEEVGADVVFAPSVEEVYPRRTTTVSVREVTERWEGAIRPGHFDGVATVVCKLLNIVSPDFAVFGLKDLQQCAVIRRMVEDLNLRVALKFCPTRRESDGLAMSSRNTYLSREHREKAPLLYKELLRCATALKDAPQNPSAIDSELSGSRLRLVSNGFSVDYFALVDTFTTLPLDVVQSPCSLITAVRLGTTRLIDNLQVNGLPT
jgi:pantoate--beta-alanine ligase